DDGRGFDPALLCGSSAASGAEADSAAGLAGANGNGLHGKEPDLPQAGGRGPDCAQQSDGGSNSTGGFGLVAMRQRIEALSGTVQVESEPGAGTGISARIPAAIAEARTLAPGPGPLRGAACRTGCWTWRTARGSGGGRA